MLYDPRVEIEEGSGWRDADRDLCLMIAADVFVQGQGGFSYLAAKIRSYRNVAMTDTNLL
jgi:hypothetical protein